MYRVAQKGYCKLHKFSAMTAAARESGVRDHARQDYQRARWNEANRKRLARVKRGIPASRQRVEALGITPDVRVSQ